MSVILVPEKFPEATLFEISSFLVKSKVTSLTVLLIVLDNTDCTNAVVAILVVASERSDCVNAFVFVVRYELSIVLLVNDSVPESVAIVPVVGNSILVFPEVTKLISNEVALKVPVVVKLPAVVIFPPNVIVLPVLSIPVPPYFDSNTVVILSVPLNVFP